MALARRNLASQTFSTDTGTYVSSSINPDADAVVFVSLAISTFTGVAPLVSGLGLTWELLEDRPMAGLIGRFCLFMAKTGATAPSPGSISIGEGVDTFDNASLFAFQVTGVNKANPVAQLKYVESPGSASELTNTLDFAPEATSMGVAICAVSAFVFPGADPAGYTLLHQVLVSDTPSSVQFGHYKIGSPDQSVTQFLSGAEAAMVQSYHLEIAEGTSGAGAAVGTHTWDAVVSGGHPGPVDLQAVGVSESQIDLTWDAVPEATAYDVERDGVVIATNVATTSYSDTGLAADSEHEYRVRGVYWL